MKKPAVIVLLFICAAATTMESDVTTSPSERNSETGTGGETTPYFDILRGRDGEDGRDGRDGKDGFPGPPGCDGHDGEDGLSGLPGRDGRDGLPGLPGRDGEDGRDGRDGKDGVPSPAGQVGKDGKDGRDGRDGKDGESGEKGEPGLLGPPGPPGPSSGGVVYTRWGRTTCPDTPGTELVYAGRAGGSYYTHKGGGANYLCLPESPDYLRSTAGHQGGSPVYGAEYESAGGNRGPLESVHDHNVPCAVCCTTARVMVLMLPAKTQCPPSWTLEYNGYLMTAHKDQHRTAFECIDQDPECIPGSVGNENAALFYHTEATCTGLPCPPYDSSKELACAVCTK